MQSDDTRQRKSPCISNYDYTQADTYFVTLTTSVPWPFFGQVVTGQMKHNPAGDMLAEWWQRVPSKFPSVHLDAFVVMPNHLHGVVLLENRPELPAPALFEAIGWFKTM